MLGKLKTMISNQYLNVLNYFPLKGCVVNFTGNALLDPTINSSYNIAGIVRSGVGTYTVSLTRTTFYGVDITSNSSIACTWNIVPIVSTDAFKIDASVAAGIVTLTVYSLTVSGTRNVRTLVDLQNTDKVSLSLIMSGGVALPPV